VVTAIVMYPLVIDWFVRPGPFAEPNQAVISNYEPAMLNLTMALVAGLMAIYGIYVLGSLRKEAFEARRMNQYTIGSMIGEGGMGQVYSARHQMLKRECALKVIRPGSDRDPTAIARLEREVTAMARLTHPSIVQVYDFGESDDGLFYFVMERLHGMSLAELLEQSGKLPQARVIHLLKQIVSGLEEAHSQGLIHRDLKPANIFVCRTARQCDVAKILDFGIVKPISEPENDPLLAGRSSAATTNQVPSLVQRTDRMANELTMVGQIAGTPAYMSPEQFTGEPASAASDIYSLGVVAFLSLAGKLPFHRADLVAWMAAHAFDEFSDLERMPEVDVGVESMVRKCLAKSPSNRYRTASELKRELDELSRTLIWTDDDAIAAWRSVRPTPT
jgi:eukaryotic-like serine/threonine-protein kinase